MLSSYGKFTFSPSLGNKVKVYGGTSTLVYTFGNIAFHDNTMCRVMNAAGTAYSMKVESCVVSSASVTLIMNEDAGSLSFSVEILNAGTGYTWSTDTVTGTLTSYGASI